MEQFFAQDGYMRLITSVHLSEDKTAIEMGMDQRELIEQHLEQLEDFLEPLKPGCKMLAGVAKKKLKSYHQIRRSVS